MRATAVLLAALTLFTGTASATSVTVPWCTNSPDVTFYTATATGDGSVTLTPGCGGSPEWGNPFDITHGYTAWTEDGGMPQTELVAEFSHPVLFLSAILSGPGGGDAAELGAFDSADNMIGYCGLIQIGWPNPPALPCATLTSGDTEPFPPPPYVYEYTINAPGTTYVAEALWGDISSITFDTPEPATLGLLGLGVAALGFVRRRVRSN